ncbi:hypothetical protein [Duganella phyllosphaerae]|nr:hypothetical protein [Duganella phyllosphaerae]
MRHQNDLARWRATWQFYTGATEAGSLELRQRGGQAIDVKVNERRSK